MSEVTELPGAQSREEKLARAEAARKAFVAKVAGAQLRAKELPRDLLKILAPAVANVMLVDLLNGKYPVRTAQEAAQIAKLASEIGRAEMGEGYGNQPMTAEERRQKIDELALMQAELKKRQEILAAQESGLPPEADTDDGAVAASA